MNFCPNCGTKITNPDDQFCMSCGQRLIRPEDLEAAQNAAAPEVPEAQPAAPEPPVITEPEADTAFAGFPAAPEADAAFSQAPAQTMPAAQEADLLGLIDDGLAAAAAAPQAPVMQPQVAPEAAPEAAPMEAADMFSEPVGTQEPADMFAEPAGTQAPADGFFSEAAAPAQADAPDLFASPAAQAPTEGFFGEETPPAQADTSDPFAAGEASFGTEPVAEAEPEPAAPGWMEEAPESFEEPAATVEPQAEPGPEAVPVFEEAAAFEAEPPAEELPAEAPEMPQQRMPQASDGPSLFDFDTDDAQAEAPAAEIPTTAPEAEFAAADAVQPQGFEEVPAAPAAESAFTQEPPQAEVPQAPAETEPESMAGGVSPQAETASPPVDGLFEAPVTKGGSFFADDTAAPPPAESFFADDATAAPPPAEGLFGEEAAPGQPAGGFFAEVAPDAPAADDGFFAGGSAPPPPEADNLFGQAAPSQPMSTGELFRSAAPPEEQHTENLLPQPEPQAENLFSQLEPQEAPYVQQYPTQEPVQQRYIAPEQSYDELEQAYQANQPRPGQLYAERYSEAASEKGKEKARAAKSKDGGRGKKSSDPDRQAALEAARADLQQELYGDAPAPQKRNAPPPPVNLPEREKRRSSASGGRSTGSRVLTFILVVLLFIVLTLGVAFVMLYLNNRPDKVIDDFMEAVAAADVEELEKLATVSGTSPSEETWAAFCATFEPTANANSLLAQLKMMAGDDSTDPNAMPYPAVSIESRPFILFIQKYSITIKGVELLAPGAAEGTVVQLNDTPYAGTATADGVLYQNLMPGLYQCRVAPAGVDPASVNPVEVTIFEIGEPNRVEGAVAKATITIENCASDDATLTVNDLPVEDRPVGGIVTLADVSVGSVIRIVAQVDGTAMEASVTFDNADVTTLRFDNYTAQGGGDSSEPDSSEAETDAYKFAADLSAADINATLVTFYNSYLKAINDQDLERIQLATASGKTSMESRVTSDANKGNLFEFVSAECSASTIKPADENGTSVVRFDATFKFKYRARPEEGEEASGEQSEGGNVSEVELVYQDGKWLVNKMERKSDG